MHADAFGGIRANQGLYISTFTRPASAGAQLDAGEARDQLMASHALGKALSDTAVKAGAEPLGGQDALESFGAASKENYTGDGQQQANRFKDPLLLMASPAGVGMTTPKSTHIHSGEHVTVSAGGEISIATGKSLVASITEKISLFAYNAGIKLFAAKGKVEIQAQGDDLDLIAEKVVRLLSTTSRIDIHAKEEVMISAGGSFIKINARGITNGTSGSWTAQASMHSMPGPTTSPYVMPHLLKSEVQKTDLEFRHLTDWGSPLAGAAYMAVLSNGSIRKGTLDAMGIARLGDLPAGVTAKVEYDYRPMQASSTVSTELHEDVHAFLNWKPAGPADKGQA